MRGSEGGGSRGRIVTARLGLFAPFSLTSQGGSVKLGLGERRYLGRRVGRQLIDKMAY